MEPDTKQPNRKRRPDETPSESVAQTFERQHVIISNRAARNMHARCREALDSLESIRTKDKVERRHIGEAKDAIWAIRDAIELAHMIAQRDGTSEELVVW